MDSEINGENEGVEGRKVVDEFTPEQNNALPQLSGEAENTAVKARGIVDITDRIVAEKMENTRGEMLTSNIYSEKVNEVTKQSLDTSIAAQQLNVQDAEIDNAIIAHKIAIKKRELDIAAKHEFKRLDYEKKIERKISKRLERAKNKASKLEQFTALKEQCELKTDSVFALRIIAFIITIGDFFKGLSYTFSKFNSLLKSLIIISLIIIISLSLWYGLDLKRFIHLDSG